MICLNIGAIYKKQGNICRRNIEVYLDLDESHHTVQEIEVDGQKVINC